MHKHASMNRAYRIVWSAARGAFVVAAETARGRSKSSRSCSVPGSAALALGIGLLGWSGMAGAQVVPATTVVPVPGKTNAYISPNGVPVVNINTANAAGVSHNQYTRYDVEKNGLVLNNGNSALSSRQSQLAGQVVSNVNLGAEAKVILNEVVSSNRSTLAGFTEVLGGKADVIVANPYGITCSGCGFINSDRVTLTTGTPNFGYDGSVAGFSVNRGDVLINGGGLNASAQQILDLVTRSVKIDGQINTAPGGTLGITTGTNQWSYATRAVTGSTTGTDAQPSYAIDSSALGGMYAGRIRLIATEAGVGVRMLGDAAADTDDFTLDAAGKVLVQSHISAQRDAKLAYTGDPTGGADALQIAGADASISAERDLTLDSGSAGTTLSEGKLKAGHDLALTAASLTDTSANLASRAAAHDVTVAVNGDATMNSTQWSAGGKLAGTVGSLAAGNGTKIYSGTDASAADRSLSLTATSGDLAFTDASLVSPSDITLTAQQGAMTAAAPVTVQASDDLALSARTALNNAGNLLAANQATVSASDAATALAVTNSGTLQAGTHLGIGASGQTVSLDNQAGGNVLADTLVFTGSILSNSGTVQATNGLDVNASGAVSNQSAGKMLTTAAGKDVTLTAASLDNAGTLQSAGALHGTMSGAIANSGTMLSVSSTDGGSNGALALQGASLDNSGTIAGNGTSTVTTDSGAIGNTGSILSQGDLTLTTASALNNTGSNSRILGADKVTLTSGNSSFTASNDGQIQAGTVLTLGEAGHSVSSLTNNSGATLLGDTATFTGNTLTNSGTLQATNGLTVTASGAVTNNAGATMLTTAATKDVALTAASLNNAGTLQSAGDLSATVSGTLSNSGTVLTKDAAGNMALQGASISNSGTLQAANTADLTATATTVTNSGTVQAQGDLTLSAATALNNSGSNSKILGAGNVKLTGGNSSFTVSNDGRIQAGGALTLGEADHIASSLANNNNASLLGNTLQARAGSVDNYGRMQSGSASNITASSLTNHGSGAVIVTGLDGSASTVSLSGNLTNEGAMHGGGDLTVSAAKIDNTSTAGLSSLGNLALTSNSGGIDNAGALYAGNTLSTTATGQTITNRSTGTMDGNDITVSAATFTNYNTVIATRNASITTSTAFNNLPTGGVPDVITGSIDYGSVTTPYDTGDYNCNIFGAACDHQWVHAQNFDVTQALSGAVPVQKGQIIAGDTLNINYGGAGTNTASLISAPNINISGSGGFTNVDLHLDKISYARRWRIYETNSTFGSDNFAYYFPTSGSQFGCNDGGCFSGGAGSESAAASGSYWLETGRTTIQVFSAGIYATNLHFSGGTLKNLGSPYQKTVNATSAGSVGATGLGNISGAGAATAAALASVPAASSIDFKGLNLSLPTNPNGYFVTAKNPDSHYLVETNPLFQVGSNFVGSDYLSVRLGFNPDTVQKRLGDSNYEAKLIRDQLIAQTGSNIIKGQQNEAAQMQALMDNAVTQSASLGMKFGQPLTPAQAAGLTEDMVWMVEQEVAGQKVLVPVVYLAQSTKDAIEAGGPVISAANADIKAALLENTGGTIEGSDKLNIATTGDIHNTGGAIKGGDVSLSSSQGSVINETVAQTNGGKDFARTVIGATGSIQSTGNLKVDAAKDITVKGAEVAAGGDASLAAGNNVTFDTIQDKSADSTYKASQGLWGLSSSSESTHVATTKNIGSSLTTGGNLNIKSGKDTTIAGSSVDAGGNLAVDAKGNFNVVSRQDTTETNNSSSHSGLGVGGGLYGATSTTTDTFKGRNVGSSIKVGGDADIGTDKTMTLQGSTLNVDGSAKIKADDVQVLAGQDVDRTTTTTTTTSFLKFDGASGKADAEAGAGAHAGARSAAAAGTKDGKASASASASAEAGAEAGAGASASASAGVTLAETTTTHSTDYNMHSVGSAITVGKDLSVDSNKSITLQGANVEAGGDVDLKAKDINVMASQDVHTSSSKTTTTQIGLYVDSDNSASAGASAQAGAHAQASANADGNKLTAGANASAGASADAQANAQASSDTTIDVMRTSTTETNSLNISNTGSTIKSGGKMKVTAGDTLTVQGSELNGEKGVSVKAKDMQFLAAEDVDVTTTKTTRTSAGLYVSGSADAQAGVGASVEAQADAHGGNAGLLNQDSAQASVTGTAGAHAGASAEAKAGYGLQAKHTSESSVEGSTTAVVSSIKSGSGDVERTADNKIVDVGTAIEAGGNFTQSATTIESHAAKNTTFSSSESQTDTARLGVYGKAEAGAEASATGSAGTGVGYLGGNSMGKEHEVSTDAGASATIGVEASYEHEHNSSSSSSSEAVVSTIKAGGKVSSTSTGKTSFEGTQINGDGGVDLSAKEIDFKAAHNTETSSDNTTTGNASAHFGAGVAVGSHAPVEGGAEGGFTNDNGTASSSTAVVGSIQSGGKLNIKTQGDARFEGTDIESAGDAKVSAGGKLTFDAAHDTSTESANSSNAQVSAEFSKSGSKGGGDSESEMGVNAEGGFSKENASSSNAVTGTIKSGGKLTLSAGKDATFEGTAVQADGDTEVSAGGNVNFNAARNTSSSESTEFSASAGIGASSSTDSEKGESSTGKSASLGVEGGYSKSTSSEAVTGSIATGGNLKIKSGGDANFEGTDIAADGAAAVNAGGNVNFKAAENTSEEIGVSASVGVSGSNTTTSKTGGAAADKPAGAGAAAAAAGMPEKAAGAAGESADAAGAAQAEGPVTERERGGELGLEAGYSKSTERKGGSISTGKGLSITSGKDANFEGTKVDSKGDISVDAKGDVNITTARSTSVGVGVSAGTEREATTSSETPEEGSASNTTSVGIEGGVQISNEGASFKSGSKVAIASGGKTALVDTKIDAKGGEQIDAKGGVERSSATNVDMKVKMSHTSKSETPEPEPAPEPETPAANGMAAAAAGLTPAVSEAKPHDAKTHEVEPKPETKTEAQPHQAKVETTPVQPTVEQSKPEVKQQESKQQEAKQQEAKQQEAKKPEAEKTPENKVAPKKPDPKKKPVPKKKPDPKKKPVPAKKTVKKPSPLNKRPAWKP